ncbi:polysaccharide biosynthesis/export family protein [uncultured Tateyamaria sp.]|uniref:polysaccharide biosynthesis/export family protein n=1 Tax=uncultured Tateyamaria sp. TaxID=455651 RepID=UPI0026352278|nr:polysaccharide biosynthesis/export family protein [uncultured Tateyamaria sp.]
MQYPIRFFASLMIIATVAACTLPRGAAVEGEINRNQDNEDAAFSVVPITLQNVSQLASWPATGWEGHYHWFSRDPGPKSNVIRPGDSIKLVIWDNQENSLLTGLSQQAVSLEEIMVAADGMIFVPYIDHVQVSGSTPDAARRQIEEQLRVVIPDPQVQLSVTSGPDNSVDAVGGFNASGNYPLPNRNYSILSLISAAGGVSSDLENPLIRVIRGGNSYEIRADDLYERPSANVILRGGDKIIAQEDERYFVALGATGSETIVPFTQERINAIEALALVDGINDNRANPKGVLILRDYASKDLRSDGTGPAKTQVVFAIDLTSADALFAARKFNINPGDLVMATESPINSVRTVFGLIGSVVGIGNALNDN